MFRVYVVLQQPLVSSIKGQTLSDADIQCMIYCTVEIDLSSISVSVAAWNVHCLTCEHINCTYNVTHGSSYKCQESIIAGPEYVTVSTYIHICMVTHLNPIQCYDTGKSHVFTQANSYPSNWPRISVWNTSTLTNEPWLTVTLLITADHPNCHYEY